MIVKQDLYPCINWANIRINTARILLSINCGGKGGWGDGKKAKSAELSSGCKTRLKASIVSAKKGWGNNGTATESGTTTKPVSSFATMTSTWKGIKQNSLLICSQCH